MREALPIEVSELATVIIAIAALLFGRWLRNALPVLKRIDIPDAVVGGMIVALLCLLAELLGGYKVRFGDRTRDVLLLVFFTTIGLSAKFAALRAGGRPLAILCAVTVLLLVLQNLLGIGIAMAWGAPAGYGLLVGSLSFVGGTGTALAWGREMSAAGFANAELVGLGAATLAVIGGALFAGPIAGWMIARHGLKSGLAPTGVPFAPPRPAESGSPPATDSLQRTLVAMLVILVAAFVGEQVNIVAKQYGLLLPGFLTAMLAGVVLTNLADRAHWRLDFEPIEKGGAFALNVFLAISLMQISLAAMAAIIVPLAISVVVQLMLAAAVAYFILFRLLGRDYDAAVASGGFLGFGIASIPVAMASMDEVARRHGPSPKAFLLITLAGSFFVDLANALIAKLFFLLPLVSTPPRPPG
jgi:ESS family glutamate:Na+ symporter